MELNNQIRKYRTAMELSQEELAEKLYVTRQSVSNWETGKNYPDIHSILRMSSLFDVSLEELIKGDLIMMKEEIQLEDVKTFRKYNAIFSVLLLSGIALGVPLVVYGKIYGIIIYVIWFILTLLYSLRVEKFKKMHNIQTYREICAFMNGGRLDEISQQREIGKRPYQKFLLAIGSALLTATIGALLVKLISLFL